MFCIAWRLGNIKASRVYVVTLSARSAYPWGMYAPLKRHRITWSPSSSQLWMLMTVLYSSVGWSFPWHVGNPRGCGRLFFSFVLFLTILTWDDALTGRL